MRDRNIYGLIGTNLSGSFSQRFFTDKFAAEGLDAEYRNFELRSIEELPAMLAANSGLRGFNVTYPYKEKIIPYLDCLGHVAEQVGAVNCVRISDDGKLYGYNTDAPGFMADLLDFVGDKTARALILGSGGAAKAVAYALREAGIRFKVVSRKDGGAGSLTYSQLTPAIVSSAKLLINATPLGMTPGIGERPEIPYGAITEEHMLYDLIYNPAETEFLRKGRELGARTRNGYGMLLEQARLSWGIWQRR